MLRILQWYVSRELAKNFALTSVGLALTFSLTGSVFSMIQAEALSPDQLLHLMFFVLPLSLTLTLPVSALFSCAMVYGRLASDNEFDACRASGVNIQRLLLPAFGLSVFAAIFTFIFGNYVLPRYVKNIELLIAKDLQKIVVSALRTQGYFKIPQTGFAVHAADEPVLESFQDRGRLRIGGASFLEIENDKLVKVGTSGRVSVDFWTDPPSGSPIAEPVMHDIRAFDFKGGTQITSDQWRFPPLVMPTFTQEKTKWLTLPELLKYRQRPTDLPAVQKQIGRLRAQFREALVYRYVVEQINEGRRVLRLDDEQGRLKYEIRAERAEHDPKDFRPELLRVSVREHLSGQVRDYQAGRCQVRVERGLGTVPLIIQLRLTDEVTLTDDRSGGGQRVKKPNQPLESVPVPPGLTDQEARLSDLELLDINEAMVRQAVSGRRPARPPPYRFQLGDQVEDARNATLYQIVEEALQVVGVIHSRVAFSVSILVMLVLAAALAIIYRGGQLLTAFVISFIPGLLIVVMNIAGRQMSEKPDTHLVGLVVIWAGIGLLAVADLVVLGRFLRR